MLLLAEAPKDARLECRLESAPVHAAGKPVLVRFIIKNTGPREVAFVDWLTPLEGLMGDVLAIRPDTPGDPIPYRGVLVKRSPPGEDAYVRLAPAAEAAREVDVTEGYDLSRPGRYTISFEGSLMDVTEPEDLPRSGARMAPFPLACRIPIEVR